MSKKKSTDFLKDLSLTDKVLYASCGIGNILKLCGCRKMKMIVIN